MEAHLGAAVSDALPDPAAPRSPWGWGAADRFPDAEARQAIGAQVGALLGFSDLETAEPVPLASADLPAPRLPVPEALQDLALTTPGARARRTHGRAFPDLLRGFHGDYSSAPDAVLLPADEGEVALCLAEAAKVGAAVVPCGGGTSVVGGIECAAQRDGAGHAGVFTLDLSRMDRVLDLRPDARSARVQAGARGPVLEDQLRPHGLTLRFFPQSFEWSTVGGWIATRAGGHFATGPTHIDDLVQSVRMVTPSGTWESRRLPGSGAGPSPDRMVLGSEGILGVITEAWLRVRPRPIYKARCTLSFPTFHEASEAARRVVQQGLQPSLCRVLDRREALLNGVSFDRDHLLLLGFESAEVDVAPLLEWAREAASGTLKGEVQIRRPREDAADEADAAGTWKAAFVDAPYLLNTLVSLGLLVDTFETACPWDALPDLHAAVVEQVRGVLKARCGGGLLSCRFTHVYPDGPAPYFTFIAPGASDWRDRLDQWKAVKEASMQAIVDHGGTITHHHAVGRTHRPAYDQQRPDAFARVLRAAKAELDPAWLLNPGVLIDPE